MKDSGILIVFMDHMSYSGNNYRGRVDRAILNHSNGNQYLGKFYFDPSLFEDIFEIKFQNGDHYRGDFSDGQMEGSGVMRFKNGDKFTGSFKND